MTEEFPKQIASDEQIRTIIEARFEKTDQGLGIEDLVEALAGDILLLTTDEKTKVVSLIGGAASGKSTLAQSITVELASRELSADSIGTDDFVVGDRAYRREHFEGKEPRAKYDWELLNRKIAAIRSNQDGEIPVPTYDPKSGVAVAAGEENYAHKVGKVDVLLVEGDFDEVEETDLKIYVHVPDQLRLENRVGRDVMERNETDEQQIRDNFYQRQETQHIPYTIPAAETADLLVDAKFADGEWYYDIYESSSQPQNS